MTISILLSLPDELLIRILSYLAPSDVVSAQLTSHRLNTTVASSVGLQYRILLEVAQYTDNPASPLDIRDRLAALRKREEAWFSLRPTFTKEIDVQHQAGEIYDITGGVYLLGDEEMRTLFSVQLPAQEEDRQVWQTIDMGPGLFVMDIGLCLLQHDLIGVVTESAHPSMPGMCTTELHLLQFSVSSASSHPTPHPLATQKSLHIVNSPHRERSISLEIAGDHLILVLEDQHMLHEPDRVLIINWRSGQVVARLNAPHGSYHGVVFLTERWFLLPNARKGKLEVYEIPTGNEVDVYGAMEIELTPIHILALPALAEGRYLTNITCNGKPNPIGVGCTKLHTTIPFYPSPEDAIIVFILRVTGARLPSGLYGPVCGFLMYVHRRAVLEVCERNSLAHSATGQSNPNQPSSSDPNPTSTPPPIPYRAWGPPITRWFHTDEISYRRRRITTTVGQRTVMISAFALDETAPYVVLDFNQWNVQRAKNALGRRDHENNPPGTEGGRGSSQAGVVVIDSEADDSSQEDNNRGGGFHPSLRDLSPEHPYPHPYTDSPDPNTPPNRWLTTAFHSVRLADVFDPSEWPVGGSLPYAACSSAKGYMWDGAMMDGEGVAGVLSEDDGDRQLLRKVQVDGFV